MKFSYNVTGEHRKALVTAISEVVGIKIVYKRMSTASYVIDNLNVNKGGTLLADDRTDEATLNKVVATLADAGFNTEIPDTADAVEPTGLVISMPIDDFSEVSLDNLRKLVENKATLIKKALTVGTKGTFIGVNDTGSLMVCCHNCSRLNVLYGIDRCRAITE